MSRQFRRQSQQEEIRNIDVCDHICVHAGSLQNAPTTVQATYPSLTAVGAINRLHKSSTEAVHNVNRRRSLTAIKWLNDWLDQSHLS